MRTRTAFLVLAAVTTGACARTGPSSSGPRSVDATERTVAFVDDEREAPDIRSDVRKLGLTGPFPWADVQAPAAYQLPYTPWTDTYWPTFRKSVAHRILPTAPQGIEIFDFHDALQSYFEAAESSEIDRIAMLSPAEKHDMLKNSDFAQFGNLSREDLLVRAKAIEDALTTSVAEAANATGTDTAVRDAKIRALRAATNSIYTLSRTPEFANRFKLTSASWSGWATVARAERNQIHGTRLSIDGTDVIDPTKRAWGWEGICHGWSPAALFSAEPRHSVMAVKPDGKKILFTEGDIRGLLSRAWADQEPGGRTFIGGRCNTNEEDLATDQYGRTYDAHVTCSGGNCGIWANRAVHYERTFSVGRHRAIRVVSWNAASSPTGYLLIIRNEQNQDSDFRAFNDLDTLQQWVETQDASLGIRVAVDAQNVCRDVNPMTFHLLLTKVMPRGQGFVMDRTRSSQVWNQPVKGYSLRFEPIPGSAVGADDLTPVESIDDPYWRYRAPRTKFLANVTAVVTWMTEDGPLPTYTVNGVDRDDRAQRELTLKYTLEFDMQRNLIGGEWGHVPVPGEPVDEDLIRGMSPDFVFYYPVGSEPRNRQGSAVDYDNVVKKLLTCSQSEGELHEWVSPSGRTTLQYSECPF